jgi:uncharacterized protein (DUF1800 family)
MAGTSDRYIAHLLRRAGFGARPDELDRYGAMSISEAIDTLVNYERIPDTVDSAIGKSGYVGITSRGQFTPQSSIVDSRQRWLFRMVHTERPLQEKMTLFWHNHFATGYDKIATALGPTEGARYLAAKPSEDPGRVQGQLEMLRDNALGNFRDILLNIAKDAAMLVWLDGRTNTKDQPQENFAREIMELFTMGVGHFTEPDVYAGARVFTGWNLQRVPTGQAPPPGSTIGESLFYKFVYNAAQHDTSAKTFSFPIYPDGGSTIPARSAADGMQDALDLIDALAANPNTARYLAGKLFHFFVSEFRPPDPAFVDRIASVYLQSRFDMRAVVREVLLTPQFWDDSSFFARYSWPVEFVVRAMKEVGWLGFSVDNARTALFAMGQDLYEPPDVGGWPAGRTWFTSGPMLARINFGSTLAANQQFNLVERARAHASTPDSLLNFFLDELVGAPVDRAIMAEYLGFLRANGPWTGSDAQLQSKSAGLVHLLVASPEYQLI